MQAGLPPGIQLQAPMQAGAPVISQSAAGLMPPMTQPNMSMPPPGMAMLPAVSKPSNTSNNEVSSCCSCTL